MSFQRLAGYLGLDPLADREDVFAHVRQLVQANQARVPTPVPAPVPAVVPVPQIPYVAISEGEFAAVAHRTPPIPGPAVDVPNARPLDAILHHQGRDS